MNEPLTDERLAELRGFVLADRGRSGSYVYATRDLLAEVDRLRAALQEAEERVAELGAERDVAGLPPDLLRVLSDQSVIVSQDGGVFDLIGQWANAPSDTAASSSPPASPEDA